MAFDYFYGAQSQQFAFYRIPKVLFTDNRFQNISTEGNQICDAENLGTASGAEQGTVFGLWTILYEWWM